MTTSADAGSTIQRATTILRVLLVVGVVESFVHYLDNIVEIDDYRSASPPAYASWINEWVILVSWFAFTAIAVVGYRRFREGRYPQAAAWIGAYSASGLISLLHYTDISLSDLSAFQNTFVFADIAVGVLVLAFAVRLAMSPLPSRAAAA